uniref:C2H2-type domain-containing protein n=1 Tax=Bubo bubo TaxID=30461 RepID=A0A8C0EFL3_BUBBB
MCLKSPLLSPFGLPTGAGTDKQKEEQCQPREEQRGMLQGPEEEPQSPTVDVEHDGQQQPDDTQGSHAPREPQKSSFKRTCAEDPQEGATQAWSNSRGKDYKCEVCGKVFTCRSKLKQHQYMHTGEKPFNCRDCGKNFRKRWNLLGGVGETEEWRRKRKDEVPIQSQKCSFKDTCAEDIPEAPTQPRRSSRQKEYLCEDCGKVFTRRNKLNEHRRIHTGEKPYKCRDCGKSFTLSGTLRRHQRTHNKEKLIPCTTCGKRFSFSSDLTRHQLIYTGERPYTCSDCSKSFQQSCQLWKHHLSIQKGEKPLKCSFNRTYSSSRGKEEYMCEYCGRVFPSTSNLTCHQETHTREKPYKCQDCGKSCSDNWKLRRHRRTHTKEKPFLCTMCGKRFSFSSHKIHTKEKRFHCNMCRKDFCFRTDLVKHQHSHMEERLYTSLHCEMTFQQSYHLYLWRHQQALQNGECWVGT